MSSGLPLKADIAQCSRHVSNVPKVGEPEKMANQLFRVQRSKLANRSASLAAKRQQIFLAITEDWPVSRAFGD